MGWVLDTLRPLAASAVGPGEVRLEGSPLEVALGAVRLRDALAAAGERPWVQLGGTEPLGSARRVGVHAVEQTSCVPLRAAQWLQLESTWLLMPQVVCSGAEEVLNTRLDPGELEPWCGLRQALPLPSEAGWCGLREVWLWAQAAGLSVVEVPPPARMGELDVRHPQPAGAARGPSGLTRRATDTASADDPPRVLLCERLSDLPAELRALVGDPETHAAVWVVEAQADDADVALQPDEAVVIALIGALGPDASAAMVQRVLGHLDGVSCPLDVLRSRRLVLGLPDGGLRVRSEAVRRAAWATAAPQVLRALSGWAIERGDRPGTLVAIAKVRGEPEGHLRLAWLERGAADCDWRGVLSMDRDDVDGELLRPAATLITRAAQAEADGTVVGWLQDCLARKIAPPNTTAHLALLGVGLCAHPEVGDWSRLHELLALARRAACEPELELVRRRWTAFAGGSSGPLVEEADLALLVMERIRQGRYHAALADLVNVSATMLDPLGLQHTVHLVLLLGLVGELRRARRELGALHRRAHRLARGDGTRVAFVLSRWLDLLDGSRELSWLAEPPRGGGARLLHDVVVAETHLRAGRVGAAAQRLRAAIPDGEVLGLLEDVGCGRGAWLAARLCAQEVVSGDEVERWLTPLRARSSSSVLASLRLALSEGVLGAARAEGRSVARLCDALESAEARCLQVDVAGIRAALASHQALSEADRRLYAGARSRLPRRD